MRNTRWIFLALGVVLLLAGCGARATTPAVTPTGNAGEPPAATPPGEPLAYQPLDIAAASLTLQVPAAWHRLEPEWAWAPGEQDVPRIGVNWADLQPPMEAEAILLPNNAQTLQSDPVELSWGKGRRLTLETYAPAAAGGDTKAPVQSVETHVLVTVQQGQVRRGYDVYLVARDEQEMERFRPVYDTVLASVNAGPLPHPTGRGTSEAGHPDWAAYTSPAYRVSFQYPANWQATGDGERHAGRDGFFQLSAVSGGGQSLDQVCDGEAHHVLQPYGSQPTVERDTVAGQEACWISPSADQPAGMGGQAALIVRYPQPVSVGSQPYEFVVLWADLAHIRDIGATLQFLAAGG